MICKYVYLLWLEISNETVHRCGHLNVICNSIQLYFPLFFPERNQEHQHQPKVVCISKNEDGFTIKKFHDLWLILIHYWESRTNWSREANWLIIKISQLLSSKTRFSLNVGNDVQLARKSWASALSHLMCIGQESKVGINYIILLVAVNAVTKLIINSQAEGVN